MAITSVNQIRFYNIDKQSFVYEQNKQNIIGVNNIMYETFDKIGTFQYAYYNHEKFNKILLIPT